MTLSITLQSNALKYESTIYWNILLHNKHSKTKSILGSCKMITMSHLKEMHDSF